MNKYNIYLQELPTPTGRNAKFDVFINGIQTKKMLPDHEANFVHIGDVLARTAIHALSLAQERFPHHARKLAVEPVNKQEYLQ